MKVLFAVDDSHFADNALETVGSRAWPAETEFRVLNVLELSRNEFDGADADVVAKLKAALETKAEILRKHHPSNNVEVRVVQGVAKEAILDEAENWGSDLIVVGSHGKKGIQKFLLGSVAESILGYAPCAVEVVKMKA